jgi:hypothetical protein
MAVPRECKAVCPTERQRRRTTPPGGAAASLTRLPAGVSGPVLLSEAHPSDRVVHLHGCSGLSEIIRSGGIGRRYRIRLSGWLHRKAHGAAVRGRRSRRSSPRSPYTTSQENRLVPRPATLCPSGEEIARAANAISIRSLRACHSFAGYAASAADTGVLLSYRNVWVEQCVLWSRAGSFPLLSLQAATL